jgi:DNA-directed RNA polymerase specialized sigma24 family protein
VRTASDAESAASHAITAMYGAQYRSLVRLSAVLVGDVSIAEQVVQDSFIAMHGAWPRLRETELALGYLRRSVVRRSRPALRRRMVVGLPASGVPGAEPGAIAQPEHSAVLSTLRTLPPRQQEALLLQFYLDLSEMQIASAMGIRPSAVQSLMASGKTALRQVLEHQT